MPSDFIVGNMQKTLTFPPLKSSETEEKSNFSVVLAYEDFETGKRAKNTYDFLVEHLGDEFDFSSQMWKFDVLSVPKLKEIAIKDATVSDIIIVSAHGQDDLAPEVKSWLEIALTRGVRAIGLVALFDDRQYADNPARTYLKEVSRAANLEFFSQPGDWPKTNSVFPIPSAHWESSGKTLSLLASLPEQDRDVLHWGINE